MVEAISPPEIGVVRQHSHLQGGQGPTRSEYEIRGDNGRQDSYVD